MIEWKLFGDRLKHPVVLPRMEAHLGMLRPSEGFADPRFKVPRTSVRFTSMVKALFDFEPGGYRAFVTVHEGGETKEKRRGMLHYPEELARRYEGERSIAEFDALPALPS